MRVPDSNRKEDVQDAFYSAIAKVGHDPDYGVSDGGHNLIQKQPTIQLLMNKISRYAWPMLNSRI